MLNEQTLNQLRALRLDGMVAALSDAATHITASELPFEQRLALLVQREVDWRDSKRLERLLKAARLKVAGACLEDIDWRGSRGLSREVITSLAGGDWLRHGHNVLLTGATGCGKTWLACALGQQAALLEIIETPRQTHILQYTGPVNRCGLGRGAPGPHGSRHKISCSLERIGGNLYGTKRLVPRHW